MDAFLMAALAAAICLPTAAQRPQKKHVHQLPLDRRRHPNRAGRQQMNQRVSRSRRPNTQTGDTFVWTPYAPSGGILRVRHTSCCGRYELASEGGQFFVLRQAENGGYEETGRGRTHRSAVRTYVALVIEHRREHVTREEPLEPDPYVNEMDTG
ncbi:hypothetical protein [Nonomuraea sp. NPDC050202]|uniref:hypothetical protein n=1 Tax=Nonomuraea sp. NPDC050202 TaxID=3155035 RepID=UPI00340EA898